MNTLLFITHLLMLQSVSEQLGIRETDAIPTTKNFPCKGLLSDRYSIDIALMRRQIPKGLEVKEETRRLEHWSTGVMVEDKKSGSSVVTILHHSIAPTLQ
jgi:hypothetical protein